MTDPIDHDKAMHVADGAHLPEFKITEKGGEYLGRAYLELAAENARLRKALMAAENARLREALMAIDGGRGHCEIDGPKRPCTTRPSTEWCAPCIARAALNPPDTQP